MCRLRPANRSENSKGDQSWYLVETRHDQLVALVRDPRPQVDGRGAHAVSHAVPERVGERVVDGLGVDVDRVHMVGSVECELNRQDARPAADVEAALAVAEPLAEQVAPDQEAPLGGNEDAGVAGDLGERQRKQIAPVGVRPGHRLLRSAAPLERRAVRARARIVRTQLAARYPLESIAGRGDQLGADPAAAAHDLRALLPPRERHRRVLLAAHQPVGGPAGTRVVAEVRVHAERHVREVAHVGDHPGHVVRRDAVDEERAHAHLLEAARSAAEEIALGAAPMLPVHAADAVAAAPKLSQTGTPVASSPSARASPRSSESA